MPYQPCQEHERNPLTCAIALGEFVREECGQRGLQEFAWAMCRFLPYPVCEQLACRLNVEIPPPPPPPDPCGPPPPKKREMNMEQILQMVKMMETMKK